MPDAKLPAILDGTSVRSQGDGRRLGWPTANIETGTDLEDGIYFGYADLGSFSDQPALVFIGTPSTLPQATRRVEAHLLDIPDADYYDQPVRLDIRAFHRPSRHFASAEELAQAIQADEQAIRSWLTS